MSLILEALKKSEAERSRQNGPGLYELRARPRRQRLPGGIIAILVVLALNLLALGYLLLRKPRAPLPAVPAVIVQQAAPTPSPAQPAPSIAPLVLPPAGARPLVEAAVEAEPATTAAATRQYDAAVPSVAELGSASGGLPELHMSLHAYDADASRRFILLNGMRLREGDALPDGLRVEQITDGGAILNWRGRRFTLPRGE
jgi:general secretion pathway protein B